MERTLHISEDRTALGLAHGPGVTEFLRSHPGVADYIEVPFEQLRHTPELHNLQDEFPVILHCASLSIAGFIPPSEATIGAVQQESSRTSTPWIGEHLAFVSADGLHEEGDRDSAPTNLTFTLCPQLSDETVHRVAENLDALRPRFSVPVILENSPQYYPIPGSTMSSAEFVAKVADYCGVDLLLDLSHLMITSLNTGTDPFTDLGRLPVDRTVEVHISGMSRQADIVWDDHATPAPDEMFCLLERVLERVRPRALTIEYNWTALPDHILIAHVEKVRRILDQ